ncbi:MAG: DUF2059 domain-containing protein [Rhodobacteraceae bacterium]|nr:DUF2059 domain-containing protein [Paracoccaceae bacterium]
MTRLIAAALVALALASPAAAESAERIDPVFDALGLGELLAIMREEGQGYGADLETELFPGRGGAEWEAVVSRVYDVGRMSEEIRRGLDAELDDAAIAAITDFFSGEQGRRIVELELAARRALLDETVEQSARDTWQALQDEGGPRWAQLEEFARVNDLVESNVAGAMTANYAFYMGLIDGRAFDGPMTEEQVLSDVWSQEEQIRQDTTDWVYSFGALAYLPLSEEEFADYIAFTATPEGQAMNAALFSAFNAMFTTMSRELGLGAARFIAGQDI